MFPHERILEGLPAQGRVALRTALARVRGDPDQPAAQIEHARGTGPRIWRPAVWFLILLRHRGPPRVVDAPGCAPTCMLELRAARRNRRSWALDRGDGVAEPRVGAARLRPSPGILSRFPAPAATGSAKNLFACLRPMCARLGAVHRVNGSLWITAPVWHARSGRRPPEHQRACAQGRRGRCRREPRCRLAVAATAVRLRCRERQSPDRDETRSR